METKAKLFVVIAALLNTILRCRDDENTDWEARWEQHLELLLENNLPHGSGIDNGVMLDRDRCRRNRLVFSTSFHHMDENGMYDGWTEHEIVIVPDFEFGFRMRITGPDRNDIKDYLADLFDEVLNRTVERYPSTAPVGVHDETAHIRAEEG